MSEHRRTTDVGFEDHHALGRRNDFIWGRGYRYERDRLHGTFSLSFFPLRSDVGRYSSLAQDEISIVLRAILFILCAAVASPGTVVAQSGTVTQYEIEAAFLYNFAKFVDWPQRTFANKKSPIMLCVYGEDPFGDTLDATVRGKTVGGRSFEVRRPLKIHDLDPCQIIFVSTSEDGHLQEILSHLNGSSALTVGETQQFAERGGHIQFVQQDQRIRFWINQDSVNRARFEMSSKLLALGKIVHDEKQ